MRSCVLQILVLAVVAATAAANNSDDEVDILHLGQFKWNNCGAPTDPVHLTSLTVSPDPVSIPGNITFSFAANWSPTITSPLKAVVKLSKKVGAVYVAIPCVDKIGSCTYDDLCQLIKNQTTCPPPLSTYGIPCQCPFTAGNYNLPAQTLTIPPLKNVPRWLTNGDYYAEGTIYNKAGARLACYEVYASIKQGKFSDVTQP